MSENFGSHLHKFLIGGANLGQRYGLINKKKQKNGLLKDLWNIGFRKIDLSDGYHGSEQIVIESDLPWTVQYKIVIPEIRAYTHKDMKEYLKVKINKLKMTDNFSLVIHNTDYAEQAYPKEIFRDLKEMAIQLGVNRFGISTYTKEEFNLVNSRVKCDVVQFPHNVLDNRFLDFGKTIKPSGIVYQARSIFLQGLLLKDIGLENWLKNFPEMVNWRDYLKVSGRSALECCLLKVVNNPLIDEIVVGFDNKQNIQDLINALQSLGSKHEDFYQLSCTNLDLIDPRKWTINET
jgi:aryl-alcohol dehydrogenase-like predicted oxidoreductase